MTNSKDRQHILNNSRDLTGPEVDALAELDDLVADMLPQEPGPGIEAGFFSAPSTEFLAAPSPAIQRQPSLEAARAWQEDRAEGRHKKIADKSAKAQREWYAAAKAAEGKGPVRSYKFHDHAPQQPHENREAYQKRIHRDRQRLYNGVTADTVQPREKATTERRAEQLKAAKKRYRAKQAEKRRRAKKADI